MFTCRIFLSPRVGVLCRLKKRSVRTFDKYIYSPVRIWTISPTRRQNGRSQTKGVPKHCRFSLQFKVLETIFSCIYLAGMMNYAYFIKIQITLTVSKCNTFGENFKFGNCFTSSMTTWNLLLGRYKEKSHQREVTRKRVKFLRQLAGGGLGF